jgi:hypothetical protein
MKDICYDGQYIGEVGKPSKINNNYTITIFIEH